MPTKFIFGLVMAAGLFLNFSGHAQGVTDSLQFRQEKLRIWCRTIEFVYQDYGADSLIEDLDCSSWEAFQQSINSNELQVNSFFQAIEKPSIYAGYTTYDAKLQKLRDEIVRKLKSSPGRIAEPARLKKVDSLQEALLYVASAPAPPKERREPEEKTAEADSQKNNVYNDQEALLTGSQQENTTLTTDEENTMDWTEIAQWALLLLLFAGLFLLWAKNRRLESELDQRMKRRKQEISAVTRLSESLSPVPGRDQPVPAGPPSLTKAEVQRLIHAEIDKLRQQQKNARQQAGATATAGKRQEQQEKNERPPKQAKPQPPAVKNVVKEEAKPNTGIYYDKLPFKGGFHQNQLSMHRNPDSIYSIQVLSHNPDEAEFWVTEDQEVQKYAMQNGLTFFEEACDYNQVEENPSRVRNLEKGKLRKNGHLWQIEKKVKVSFE